MAHSILQRVIEVLAASLGSSPPFATDSWYVHREGWLHGQRACSCQETPLSIRPQIANAASSTRLNFDPPI